MVERRYGGLQRTGTRRWCCYCLRRALSGSEAADFYLEHSRSFCLLYSPAAGEVNNSGKRDGDMGESEEGTWETEQQSRAKAWEHASSGRRRQKASQVKGLDGFL
jgi:hypothetical protein